MAGRKLLDAKTQRDIDLAQVAWALSREAEVRRLASRFHEASIPVLHLPSPAAPWGTVAAAVGDERGEIELLVPSADAHDVEVILERDGWDPVARDMTSRLNGSATYDRGSTLLRVLRSVRVVRPLPRRLTTLERALWRGATSRNGVLEPRAEPLFVLRAVRARARRPGPWNDDRHGPEITTPPEGVDRAEVRRLARRSRVQGAFRTSADRLHPAALVPDAIRARWREAIAMRKAGYGFVATPRRSKRVHVGGLAIDVPPGVFEPRLPITTTLIDSAVSWSEHLARPRVVEVGTGCGAIAFGYATARPDAHLAAVDISHRAVASARRNRNRLGLLIQIAQSNLLDQLPDRAIGNIDVIVANVPYIPPSTAPATDWGAPVETVQGLDQDGLGLILRLARQATRFLRPGGLLVLQLTGWQWETLEAELTNIGYRITQAQTWGDDRAAIACAVWAAAEDRPTRPGGRG